MHDHEDHQDHPEPEEDEAVRVTRRAIVFEELLRAGTALMVVVFSVSIVTAIPFVPDWVFAAALGGVALSVPATVYVRTRLLDEHETRSLNQVWNAALVGATTLGLVITLLPVVARLTDLGPALTRLAGVVAALGVIAYLRGWRPSESAPVLDSQVEDRR